MHKVLCVLLFLVAILPAAVSAQSTWARDYHNNSDGGASVSPTADGGFVVAGYTGDAFGSVDIWVLKLNAAGAIEWQKMYGGTGADWPSCIFQTSDGGYFVCGYSYSFGAGDADFWLLKLSNSGDMEWQKVYGGAGYDQASSAQQTTDGGYIVAGRTTSFGTGEYDAWVLKLSSSGSVQWQREYGNAFDDTAQSIMQTPDGGYIVAGENAVASAHENAWIAKLDANGNVQWDRQYGTVQDQIVVAIKNTSDGGYVAAVRDTDAAGVTYDFVVLKIDSNGLITWQYRFSGGGNDEPWDIEPTTDGGYLVAGNTTSFGAGGSDFWVLKLNASGNVQWQKTLGGPTFDVLTSARQASDVGYVLAGFSEGNLRVIKLDASGNLSPTCTLASDSLVTPAVSNFFVAGNTSTVTNTVATINSYNAVATNTNATSQEICGPVCTYCDDFEDGVLASDWTYLKPAWSESGGNLVATATRKAIAIASPAFAGCGANCTVQAEMMSSGGPGNAVWMLAWYTDKHNALEVMMKEGSDKILMKQKSAGILVAKAKASIPLLPNVSYDVKVTYDGITFTLFVNGNPLLSMPAAGSANGTVGFQAKNTVARFGSIRVE